MVPSMITSDSVIDALGGTKSLADALSLAPSTVSVWRVRGIPSAHWLALSGMAAERGLADITLEALAKLDAREVVEASGARA